MATELQLPAIYLYRIFVAWDQRFDKPLADLFDMHEEIVARLASQLGTQLIAAEARRAGRVPAPNSTDLFSQGMACLNEGRITESALTQAYDFLERALDRDPGNVPALVGTAIVNTQRCGNYMTDDRSALLAVAEANVTRAQTEAWLEVTHNKHEEFWSKS